MVAVGTSRAHPGLHALTSAEHPERPLALYRWQWEALARNPRPAELADWPCGGHGAEEEATLRLRTDRGAVHATRITSTCPDEPTAPGAAGKDRRFVKKILSREVL